jgi:hypothetical protein
VDGKRQRYNGVMCADISNGQERQAIPAMNDVDTSPVRPSFHHDVSSAHPLVLRG